MTELEKQYDALNKKIAEDQRLLANLAKRVEAERLTNSLKVSDHALIRFYERVLHSSVQVQRERILPKSVREQYSVLGDGKYQVENFWIIIKRGIVVTVLTEEDQGS